MGFQQTYSQHRHGQLTDYADLSADTPSQAEPGLECDVDKFAGLSHHPVRQAVARAVERKITKL
jgi:hypothetical protein